MRLGLVTPRLRWLARSQHWDLIDDAFATLARAARATPTDAALARDPRTAPRTAEAEAATDVSDVAVAGSSGAADGGSSGVAGAGGDVRPLDDASRVEEFILA